MGPEEVNAAWVGLNEKYWHYEAINDNKNNITQREEHQQQGKSHKSLIN